MHDFFPESIPVLRDPNHPDDFVYSCFFSESTHFVTSVTAEYFLKPHEVTVLELMCLARRDFIDEGNSLKNQGHMELEFTQRSDIRITRIPLDLLDNILSEAISRKSPLTMNFDPETRIQKYCDSQVFPRVNPMLYDEFDDDFE